MKIDKSSYFHGGEPIFGSGRWVYDFVLLTHIIIGIIFTDDAVYNKALCILLASFKNIFYENGMFTHHSV